MLKAFPDGTHHRVVRDRRLPPAIRNRENHSGWRKAICSPGRSTMTRGTRSSPTWGRTSCKRVADANWVLALLRLVPQNVTHPGLRIRR